MGMERENLESLGFGDWLDRWGEGIVKHESLPEVKKESGVLKNF